jgi:hypothetical protein
VSNLHYEWKSRRKNNNSKKASKSNIEESPEPIGKPDPTEPVTVSGGAGGSKGEAKGTTI